MIEPAHDDSPTLPFRRTPSLRVGFVGVRDRVDRAGFARGLERALARSVRLTRYASYAELSGAVRDGDVELAWLPPTAYVRARRTDGVRLLAIVERNGRDGYRSALLARTGQIRDLADLRGARTVWVDPWSAAGYLMPRGMLAAHGLPPSETLRGERFVGSYDAAIDALTGRSADVTGAMCTVDHDGDVVDRGWSSVAPVRVLEISPPIPSDVLCASAAVSPDDADGFERALAGSLGAIVAAAIGGTGLAAADPAHYDALERTISIADGPITRL